MIHLLSFGLACLFSCSSEQKSSTSTINTNKQKPKVEKTQPSQETKKTTQKLQPAVDKPIQKVITLGGNITETVYALGEGNKVVGVDVSSLYPAEATKQTKVGYYRQISAEGIISLAPDLVIASTDAGPPDALAKLDEVGVKMEKLNGKKSLEGAVERITKIAAIFNKVEEGKKLVQTIKDDIDKTQKPAKAPKVLFIYARGAGSMNVAGKDTSADEMIKLAGGINAVQEYEGYKPINSEAIVAAAPDFILLTSRGLTSIGGKEAVSKLPGIALTPAGKQQKIISMDDLLLLGFGPRTGKAVAELAQAFQK